MRVTRASESVLCYRRTDWQRKPLLRLAMTRFRDKKRFIVEKAAHNRIFGSGISTNLQPQPAGFQVH